MRAVAAVRVDDDLATGQTAVALRTANHEAAGRVDEEAGVLEPFGRHDRTDDLFNDFVNELSLHVLALGHFRGMLRGEHDRVATDRLAVAIAERHLALGVRAQSREGTVLAHNALTLDETVGVVDRRGHEGRRFVAGVTEHQALVAGTEVEFVVGGAVDTLSDVLRLLVVTNEDGATLMVDAVFGVVIADALENVAGEADVIDVGARGDFTCENDEARGAEGFRGNAAHGILFETGVEDGVRDLVRDLVGMTFTDGFGSKKIFAGHCHTPLGMRRTAPNAMRYVDCQSIAQDALAVFVIAPQVVFVNSANVE